MNQPGTLWDGRQWVTVDELWAWDGRQWIQHGSTLSLAARVAIYAGVGLALNLPIMFVLALFWGLQGPGWAASPPDVIASVVQIALTLGGAFIAFCAGWFLVRIDRRDWWLGAAFAWTWIASAAVLAVGSLASNPVEVSGLVVSACLLLFAVFPLSGSIVGRRWRSSASPRQSQPEQSSTPISKGDTTTWRYLRALFGAVVAADLTTTDMPMALPANISADGKYEWNGERWVPIEQFQSRPPPEAGSTS